MARGVLYTTDQLPTLPATVTDSSGDVMDLTPFTKVEFALRAAFDTTNSFKAVGDINSPATNGSVTYTLGSSDLATVTPGIYVGQWILTESGGAKQHVDAGEFEVRTGY